MTGLTDPATPSRLTFGRTVRALRWARGLTVRELAELLQVSPATVSAIENGKTGISAQRAAHLAGVFDVPVQRMFLPHQDHGSDVRPAQPGRAEVAGPRTADLITSHRTGLSDPDWREFPPLGLDPALSGALSSFLEFGYHGATMRTIAERAQLSVAGLYHYYASKQDMLVALLDLTMADLRERSLAARGQGRAIRPARGVPGARPHPSTRARVRGCQRNAQPRARCTAAGGGHATRTAAHGGPGGRAGRPLRSLRDDPAA